jgi:hypothetical protein
VRRGKHGARIAELRLGNGEPLATTIFFYFVLDGFRALPSSQVTARPEDVVRGPTSPRKAFNRVEVGDLDARDWRQARGSGIAPPDGTALPTPARLTPQRYHVQFTASEEHVKLVEKARALLSHSTPSEGLDQIHLRALRALSRVRIQTGPSNYFVPRPNQEHAHSFLVRAHRSRCILERSFGMW